MIMNLRPTLPISMLTGFATLGISGCSGPNSKADAQMGGVASTSLGSGSMSSGRWGTTGGSSSVYSPETGGTMSTGGSPVLGGASANGGTNATGGVLQASGGRSTSIVGGYAKLGGA
jgi:hypothetical protein